MIYLCRSAFINYTRQNQIVFQFVFAVYWNATKLATLFPLFFQAFLFKKSLCWNIPILTSRVFFCSFVRFCFVLFFCLATFIALLAVQWLVRFMTVHLPCCHTGDPLARFDGCSIALLDVRWLASFDDCLIDGAFS